MESFDIMREMSAKKEKTMEKKQIAEFFDHCAPWWDADLVRNEQIIAAILDNAGIR